jgi:hypothetical protein
VNVKIEDFTGSISILYNKTKGVHGFTGLAPYQAVEKPQNL